DMAARIPAPAPRNAPIRVLVLHGQQMLADVIAAALQTGPQIQVAGIETNPSRAIDVARQSWPDVIVAQFGTEWMHIASPLSVELGGVTMLVLVPSLDHDILLACAQAGAVGYLTLDQPLTELLRAVERVHTGEVLFDARLMRDLLVRSARVRQATGPQTLV